MNLHQHEFKIECESVNNHTHRVLGYTESTIGVNLFHFHHFWGICTYNGHTHYFSGFTGLPAKTSNGHVHKIEGILELNNGHEHKFSGFTFEEVQYVSKKFIKTALA
ncbi:MAG: YmaF family protein [Clostridia bacterium]|nr:YmaF family protein [Clostridia bacterium]